MVTVFIIKRFIISCQFFIFPLLNGDIFPHIFFSGESIFRNKNLFPEQDISWARNDLKQNVLKHTIDDTMEENISNNKQQIFKLCQCHKTN